MARLQTIAALFLLATSHALADTPPVFVLSTAAGEPLRGSLDAMDESWSLRLGGQNIKASGWTSLSREGRPLPPYPVEGHVVLTNGDRVRIEASSLSLLRDRLGFRAPSLDGGKAVSANLSAVSLIWRTAPDSVEDTFTFTRRLLATKPRRDTIVLRNGDQVDGILARLEGDNLEIDSKGKRIKLDMRQVSAMVPSGDLASNLWPKPPWGRLTLADGTRLTIRNAKLVGSTLRGTTALGLSFATDLADVLRLDLRDEKVFPLTLLTPMKYQHTPYLGVSWPLGVNTNAAGQPLQLNKSMFHRGIGMHSASRTTYILPPDMRLFEASVGLDDVLGKNGSARVRVLVDGKEQDLGIKGDLKPGVVLPVRVTIKGGSELTLVVDFGEGGDVGDHVNWVHPLLIR